MASERNEQHLLALIENMQRAGHDETAIVRAVESASDPSGRPRTRKGDKRAWLDFANDVTVKDVRLAAHTSVWPTAVLRGDINFIEIGEGSNIQDGSIVHLADDLPVRVGKLVTVGHRAVLHACVVEDECLIGMGATILDGAVIGKCSIIGSHALVTKEMRIPPGSLVMGMPAKVVRPLRPEEIAGIRVWADHYIDLAPLYKKLLDR